MRSLKGIDPSVYFITDTYQCKQAGRSIADTVMAAIQGGAGMVQLRDKHLSDQALYTLAIDVLEAMQTCTPDQRVALFINDRVEVVKRLRTEGHDVHIHIGQDDMPASAVRTYLGHNVLIGLSTNTPEAIATANANKDADLLGVGAVFATQTKKDVDAVIGVEGLSALTAMSHLPVVAIGGINVNNAAYLRTTGIIGICAVSAICLADDPKYKTRELYRSFKGRPQ